MDIILALDIGKTRVGIAKGDALGILVKPWKTVVLREIQNELKLINQEYTIQTLVIGLPINPELSGNNETEKFIRNTANAIQTEYPHLKIVFVNESFSSREAESRIKEAGIKLNKDNKDLIDSYAAAILLEQFLKE